jgi:hypothetical protein
MPGQARQRSWPRRIAWFAGLWLASVATLGAVAFTIRFWLTE